ncbi:NADH dehydrogenase [ubiquinone] 1 beta subcomplex subunit 7 [Chelonus insularis]|uniref:NADH dehydrogenase [ubiquinone] 1 beta subcomplex subunit 7 n=1 Tax=Chelonus insularis TaxID=460826 RepID=UPI00158B5A09|nr:NADH dehydrogenase [ubiquinone] 1 beta subcomplex subunit 7 [Chelonus insularis]
MGSTASYVLHPDVTPMGDAVPSFDPNYGFPNGRKERVMIATEKELMAGRVEPEFRDYCAHLFLEYDQCRYNNFPWVVKCGREVHKWNTCSFEDYVLRMKEYERERRLLERQKRKREKEAAAA